MPRYALIDTNTGYVWHVTEAETARQACSHTDLECGGRVSAFEPTSDHDATGTYDAYEAGDYDCEDGTMRDAIDRCEALPFVGRFKRVEHDDDGQPDEAQEWADFDPDR